MSRWRKGFSSLVMLASVVLIIWVAVSGMEAYQNRFQEFCERRQKTDISLAELNDYAKQGYTVLTNIDHFNWTVLEYYYPDNFIDYYKMEDAKIDKAIILLEQELSQEEIMNLEGGKYTISFQNQGQIDATEYYLYSLEKR